MIEGASPPTEPAAPRVVWDREAVVEFLKPQFRKACADIKQMGPRQWYEELRPFIMAACFLAFVPITLPIMAFKFCQSLSGRSNRTESPALERSAGKITIKQHRPRNTTYNDDNFYLSPAFPLTLAAVFVSGVPAALTFLLYNALGVDAILGNPSADPQFLTIFGGILLYFYSVGWSLSILFFRAWFTLPAHFTSIERKVELTPSYIRRGPVKGWIVELFDYCDPAIMPKQLAWDEVRRIDFHDHMTGRMAPLPNRATALGSQVHALLNRMATVVDGLATKVESVQYITVSGDPPATHRHRWFRRQDIYHYNQISIDLRDLSTEDRMDLFRALREWAPSVYLSPLVQEKLVGSPVLSEPRYTQIWFDLLMHQGHARSHRRITSRLASGDTLKDGRFTVIERLATGGQANIYKARGEDGRQVVLKEFILAESDAFGARIESASDFERETAILSRLSHRQIVTMHDMFAEGERVYIVLEHLEGRSLRKVVREDGALSEPLVLDLAIQMCDILEHLHGLEPPVVHRDFSPDNLILDNDGRLTLIDFSVAMSLSENLQDCVGKHAYIPPEQFGGEAVASSDIYALGATLHDLLTGRDPVPVMRSSPATLRPEISARLNKIVETATETEIERRYESADWIRLDLRSALRA